MMIRLLMAGVLAGLIVSSPAFAQDKASQKFLKEAMEGNLAEVQMPRRSARRGFSSSLLGARGTSALTILYPGPGSGDLLV